MWRNGILLVLACTASFVLRAQLQNSFTVSNNQDFDKVKFSLNATNGQCFIEPGQEQNLMDIHSNTKGAVAPHYNEQIVNRTKEIRIALEEKENSTLGSSFSQHLFSSKTDDDYNWKVYLSKLKPLDLDLNYAVGDTYIDLSDLPIEKLKMRTGSANVMVKYSEGMGNKMEMDTFLIKVDMGTFEAKNLHLCNSNYIITDIGFGKVKMDFNEALDINTNVKATVGAGKLEILLPGNEVTVKINVNDSPLCHIKIPKGFEKLNENVFISPGFEDDQSNHINFDVDVAVGNIVFTSSAH